MAEIADVVAIPGSAMQRIRKYWLIIITYFKPSPGGETSEVAPANVISKVAPAAEQDEYGEFYFSPYHTRSTRQVFCHPQAYEER